MCFRKNKTEITNSELYPNVRIFEVENQSRGFFLLPSKIYLPKKHFTGYIQHEYGHYLQYKAMGWFLFIFGPMLYSLISASLETILGKNQWNHRYSACERGANRRSAKFFKRPADPVEVVNTIFNDSLWPK